MQAAVEFVRAHAAQGGLLIVGATMEAADDLALAACDRAMLGLHRMSLAQLASAVAEPVLAAANCTRLDALGTEALAYAVVRKVLPQLTHLGRVAELPGFPRALTRTLRDLRLARVRPQQLADAEDLALLLASWEAALGDRQLADLAMIYRIAADSFANSRFAGYSLVEIDLGVETAAERDLLAAVRAAASAVHVVDTCAGSRPQVSVCSASSEALEAVEVARHIHAAAARETSFDQMAILLRSPERQQPVIEEVLERAGIPAWFARGARRPDPAGRAFLALLTCRQEGLTEASFGEYLSLGQIPAEGVWRWERMILRAGVVAGRERWHSRLATLPESDEREALIDYLLPLIDRLAALPTSATWGVWLESLEPLAEYALRNPTPVNELLEELVPMADVGPIELRDVLAVLEPRLRNLCSNKLGDRYGRVFVGSVDDARGLRFRLVFLPGMTEGQFPRPVSEDPLLLNDVRRAVSPDLRLAADDQERELFRVAMSRSSERVVLSWSHLEVLAGRERVPSFYLLETMDATGAGDEQVDARLGWPAPSDAAQAIDASEYDLAVLRPAFTGEAQRGAVAWLKDVHPPVVDALRARGRRWLPRWRSADGLLAEDDIAALIALDSKRPTNRAWSPTALQRYAVCPYQFALHGIVGLRPRELRKRIARIDPLTRGDIFHRVQYRFLTDSNQSIDAILDDEASMVAEQLAPTIPQLWAASIEMIRTDLHGWLAMRRNERDWTPVALEREIEDVVILGGWRVKGRIDLVERHPQSGLRVTDHKTGRVPEDGVPQSIGRGEVLQPAIYALAAEQYLSEPVTVGRLFYSTLRTNYRTFDIQINDMTRDRLNTLFTTVDAAIEKGFLPAAPRAGACERCEYLPVCGPWEEERIALKQQGTLRPLRDLRKSP